MDPALFETLLIRGALTVTVLALLRVLASFLAAWWRHRSGPSLRAARSAVAPQGARNARRSVPPESIGATCTGGVTVAPVEFVRCDPNQVMVSEDPPTGARDVPAAHEFVIRVLGPVDVVDRHGHHVMIGRARSTELLAWLALHRNGTSRSGARAALWDTEIGDAAFANVVSGARRALARHLPGVVADWLGPPQSGSLLLDPRVVSDVDLFGNHLLTARRSSGRQRVTALRAALSLVRGAPLLGANYRWADDEAVTSSLTLLVVDAARDLGEICLRSGDTDAVLQATAVGLGVLPGHEELVALRLRAHHAAGAHAALRAEWESYCRAVGLDSWSTGPAPWLAELAGRLLTVAVSQ